MNKFAHLLTYVTKNHIILVLCAPQALSCGAFLALQNKW